MTIAETVTAFPGQHMKPDGSGMRPARRRHKATPEQVNEVKAWVRGYVTGLAEMHRRLLGGSDSTGVVAAAKAGGINLALARDSGCMPFDVAELKRAGVK